MRPEVAALDVALARAASFVTLRRQVGMAPNVANIDLPNVPAAVRSYGATELVGDIKQTDSHVVISPTPIVKAQWPGGELPGAIAADPSLPRRNDQLVIAGRVRNIEVVDPIYIGFDLVRIEMRVSG